MKMLVPFLALIVSVESFSADHVLRVGDEPSCTHSDLQAAVADATQLAPDSVELRVTRGSVIANPPLVIEGGRIDLTGGWTSCDSNRRLGVTSLIGDGSSSVMEIEGRTIGSSRERTFVSAERLLVSGGRAVRGGGVLLQEDASLTINASEVVGNEAQSSGAGVFVSSGADFVAINSIISGNVVRNNSGDPRGGGIACEGSSSFVSLLSGTVVANNVAQRDGSAGVSLGGGGYAGTNCFFQIVGDVTFRQNRAVQGGGLFLASELPSVWSTANGIFPTFDGNQVSTFGVPFRFSAGGAFYLDDGAAVRFDRLRAISNGTIAAGEGVLGGMFYLSRDAELIQNPFDGTSALPSDCSTGDRCTLIEGNRADRAALGVMEAGSTLTFDGLLITGHDAPGETLIEALGDVELRISNSVVVGNSVEGILESRSSGGLKIALLHDTIADNPGLGYIFRPLGTGNEIRFANNLVIGPVGANIADSTHPDSFAVELWQCHVGTEISDQPFDRQVVIEEPRFNDPARLDYGLRQDSPAIDICPAPGLPLVADLERDIDGDRRPFDHASAPDTEFLSDGGADEATQEAELNAISVNLLGPGLVTALGGAIECPGDCEEDVPATEIVVLNAIPDADFEVIWGGACLGTQGSRCEINMLGDRIVDVDFVVPDIEFADGFEVP